MAIDGLDEGTDASAVPADLSPQAPDTLRQDPAPNPSFVHWPLTDSVETDAASAVSFSSPTAGQGFEVLAWGLSQPTRHVSGHSVFGLALGDAVLRLTAADAGGNCFPLRRGMYFAAPGGAMVTGGAGLLVVSSEHTAMFAVGGPIEAQGRLPYIDGCTDSLLVAPPTWGDPCLNHLHFPPRILQTQHTHPSARVGAVVRGQGVCVYIDDCGRRCQAALVPGVVFVIPADAVHSFQTFESSMDVVAWHPDSDFGPQPDDHPMVNKTLVDGVSAAKLPKIRTSLVP